MRMTGEIIATTPFAMYLFGMHARIISAQPPTNKFEGATRWNLSDYLTLLFLSLLNKTPNYTLKITPQNKWKNISETVAYL